MWRSSASAILRRSSFDHVPIAGPPLAASANLRYCKSPPAVRRSPACRPLDSQLPPRPSAVSRAVQLGLPGEEELTWLGGVGRDKGDVSPRRRGQSRARL